MCLKVCTSFMHSRPTCVGVNYISVKKLYKMLLLKDYDLYMKGKFPVHQVLIVEIPQKSIL